MLPTDSLNICLKATPGKNTQLLVHVTCVPQAPALVNNIGAKFIYKSVKGIQGKETLITHTYDLHRGVRLVQQSLLLYDPGLNPWI